ncbi:putative Rho protein GDP-dissociation inhibitor [Helianthus annuus]|uniref:Putative rho GDP-dissociation inhibitor n=1 Tax=Helianthus annuus TaxID=4232 RepID=A0A251UZI3_HELAN|nr:rho GDP-dissociation inhibitor 1 [Helianthus annuus]KAF5810501.1 putative Rho protein GDP-dissociation inhibitor [Helianthus annuus]KAJ0581306.1 putative Rho protein GDP-dissociation inhibitor [Helianthus annuus]KAJ0589239.1 putative Rho protein GDP-dissociation inhibitor [Helianthus annuus]KAJ0597252.1 putative Rho protein GDP-dissociation inhibitor [Helianthus annuus]KAJ0757932.1 putative Rho protein GDP-dissociation inhibitor [Helianthus annuus]
MEGGKGAEAGTSSGSSSVVNGDLKNKQAEEIAENLSKIRVLDNDHDDDDVDVDDDEQHQEGFSKFVPGPLLPLKEQLDKDKDDESLRRWKEKLLGCVEGDLNGEKDPEVKFLSIGVISKDVGEITCPLPVKESQSGRPLFTLREGVPYRLKLTFTVLHNIVSGLTCINTAWKGGIQVDRIKSMLGTFAPQKDAYVEMLDEETTPSGILARGIYTAKLRFEDDDKRCHLELDYSFEIKKKS